MTIMDTMKICPGCQKPLPPNGPQGLCPECLIKAGLGTGVDLGPESQAGVPAAPAAPPPAPAEIAPNFPQLEILVCLGRGGMGVVYKARQKSLDRFVALKLLAPERVGDPQFAERFTREAKALAALNHPNIVTIHDFGQASGFYYLLMEFVDGVNLRQAMKAARFTPEQALAIVPPVCEALQYAHEHGIVHRDIKPENLLLDKEGRVKIADFGIAKMLGAGESSVGLAESQPAGTPQYMAPEQKEHRRTDHRADIYSLGVVLYELLTGELPADKLQPPSRKVRIDVRLDAIVLRALEKTPELRYRTADELLTQVEAVVSTPRGSQGNEAPSNAERGARNAGQPPRLLKTGRGFLFPPDQFTTAAGQFFAYRTNGQLILDNHQLTHSRDGVNTIIPLAAIRDLSLPQYPRTMAPVSCDLISISYEADGQSRQVLLSPMVGWIASSSDRNALAAEWFTAIRNAVTAATGRAPATTPREQLRMPRASRVSLALSAGPLFALAFLAGCLMYLAIMRQTPGAPTTFPFNVNPLGIVFALPFVFASIAFGLPWLARRRNRKGNTSAASSDAPSASNASPRFSRMTNPRLFFVVGFVFLLAAVLLVVFFLRSVQPTGVTRFDCVPVGVSNNVVIVDVTTKVGRGNAELRAVLEGPQLPAATEAALQDAFFPPFAGRFVKPTPHAGNHAWLVLPAAGHWTWRLGFVLPDAALAREAFDNLRPIDHLPAEPGRPFVVALFDVRHSNDQEFRASLQAGPPITSADPKWVLVSGHSQHNETAVTLNWEVLASRPGVAWLSRAGSPIKGERGQPIYWCMS